VPHHLGAARPPAPDGQVERAIGFLGQALRIGEEIKDPRMSEFATLHREQLREGGSDEHPETG
jgi:hypothetical protein